MVDLDPLNIMSVISLDPPDNTQAAEGLILLLPALHCIQQGKTGRKYDISNDTCFISCLIAVCSVICSMTLFVYHMVWVVFRTLKSYPISYTISCSFICYHRQTISKEALCYPV